MRAEALKQRLMGTGLLVRWPEGAPVPDLAAVTTDSRHAGPGALFAAYRGSDSDAHAFLGAAVRGGATAALVGLVAFAWMIVIALLLRYYFELEMLKTAPK